MKYNLIIFFLLLNTVSFSQVEWRCVYNDTLSAKFTDSAIQNIGAGMREKNLPQEMIEAVIKQMSSVPVLTLRTRYVSAYKDSTWISLETLQKGAVGNNSIPSENYLLKRGDIYRNDRIGNPDSIVTTPRKTFESTGRLISYFNNVCKEYVSTDNTCTIWIAEQLPSCINPGIRVGDIKGAILYFKLRFADGMEVRCGIATIGTRI